MPRYIDADALQKQLCKRHNEFMQSYFIDETYKKGYSNGYLEASILAENATTADVVEVKHGLWIEGKSLEKCSICGKKGFSDWLYCPHCGAKMDGERKEQT